MQNVLIVLDRTTCIDQYTTIADIAIKMPPLGWSEVFKKTEDELIHISNTINCLPVREFFPLKKNLFRAFDLCPLDRVKVVILGQNPYDTIENGEPLANGLAFSTSKGITLGDSCRNIFMEIRNEYPDFIVPNHGDLSSWALQGVLLLNSSLTVTPNQPEKCHIVWQSFITRIFEAITVINPNCIYLLLGSKAQKWHGKLSQRSIKLMATHPSPNSAYRGSKEAPAFMGCGHFRTINEYLVKFEKTPINWKSVNE